MSTRHGGKVSEPLVIHIGQLCGFSVNDVIFKLLNSWRPLNPR